jgi:hypothetical protein
LNGWLGRNRVVVAIAANAQITQGEASTTPTISMLAHKTYGHRIHGPISASASSSK